eukprot:gb/GEZN01015817.1/.p2 GENE.gb/GEZN01015817.1/~~gb/GEZN01015817.1/.p2  ORF type:complete len:109 (-),score=13.78 gb/GEZN01015817.1/:392-718(-)
MPRDGSSMQNFQRAMPNITNQNFRRKLGSRETKSKVHKLERQKLSVTKASKEIARARVLPVNWWFLSLGLILAIVVAAGFFSMYDPFGWYVDKTFRYAPIATPLIREG